MDTTLSIVATPIGNLEDVTLRALRVLKDADVIFCEDTRVTGKLLTHYEITDKHLVRADAEKEMEAGEKVVSSLTEGKSVAYVTDAGTPCISDPGSRLVAFVRDQLPEVRIEAIPGPSSLTAALSIAGIDIPSFTFLGFVPHKKGRETFFSKLSEYGHPVVFFESTHRILKTLEALTKYEDAKMVTVVKEVTKIHERVVQGTPQEVLKVISVDSALQKGEFVLIVSPN